MPFRSSLLSRGLSVPTCQWPEAPSPCLREFYEARSRRVNLVSGAALLGDRGCGHSLFYKCPSAGVTQRAPLLQTCPRSPGSETGGPPGGWLHRLPLQLPSCLPSCPPEVQSHLRVCGSPSQRLPLGEPQRAPVTANGSIPGFRAVLQAPGTPGPWRGAERPWGRDGLPVGQDFLVQLCSGSAPRVAERPATRPRVRRSVNCPRQRPARPEPAAW